MENGFLTRYRVSSTDYSQETGGCVCVCVLHEEGGDRVERRSPASSGGRRKTLTISSCQRVAAWRFSYTHPALTAPLKCFWDSGERISWIAVLMVFCQDREACTEQVACVCILTDGMSNNLLKWSLEGRSSVCTDLQPVRIHFIRFLRDLLKILPQLEIWIVLMFSWATAMKFRGSVLLSAHDAPVWKSSVLVGWNRIINVAEGPVLMSAWLHHRFQRTSCRCSRKDCVRYKVGGERGNLISTWLEGRLQTTSSHFSRTGR